MASHAVVRRAFSAVLIGLVAAICAVSRAAPGPTDYTDHWWNPDESGWGVQFVQQVDVIFATIYVYDRQSSPDWYAAALWPGAGGAWKGDLYATRGPWFGGPFDSTGVAKQRVGDMTVTFASSSRGTLSYSVDGVPVTKAIERYTMRTADVSGGYMFWMNATTSACGGYPAQSGALAALGDITHSGGTLSAQMQLIAADGTLVCEFSGRYAQSGKLARTDGTYTCEGGASGTYSMSDLETAPDHMCGELTMRNNANGCTLSATFASVRN
jgi:hypothetical protein